MKPLQENHTDQKIEDISYTIKVMLNQLREEAVETVKPVTFSLGATSTEEFYPNGIVERICSRLFDAFERENLVEGLSDYEDFNVLEPDQYIRQELIVALSDILRVLKVEKFNQSQLEQFLLNARKKLFEIKSNRPIL